MSFWWCCCEGEGCLPLVPGQSPAGVSGTPCDWNVISGTWPSPGTECTSDGICLLSCYVPNPVIFYAEVTTVDEQVGQSWTIILNSNATATTYYFARFTRTTSTACLLEVGFVSGGAETILDGYGASLVPTLTNTCNCPIATPNDTYTSRKFWACLSAEGISAGVEIPKQVIIIPGADGFYFAWKNQAPSFSSTRPYVGLKAGGASVPAPVKFSEFGAEAKSSGTTDCGTCCCRVPGGYAGNAKTLTVTIVNTYGCCVPHEGTSFQIIRATCCAWYGSYQVANAKGCFRFGISSDGSASLTEAFTCTGFPNVAQCIESASGAGVTDPISYTLPGPRYSCPTDSAPAINCGCVDPAQPDCPGYPCWPPPGVYAPDSGFDYLITE